MRHESNNTRQVAPASVFLVLPTSIRTAVTVAVGESTDEARTGKVDLAAVVDVGLDELDRAKVLETAGGPAGAGRARDEDLGGHGRGARRALPNRTRARR